ncbi:CPBP family intramembrane metalloprotease [Lachnospiraceae bacterium MD1]|jgi:membrane protease YdiL (CAAX protease family)|uniref:CPBP family intramembrane metalloprotease n=1 Tax=Variimorphobacter saccharofermentans TaxID=2755051 RepID=A0A839K212_9FIRM|nr:CPBP family intramembrane glutamic endopeptidase [Variimorphobacter saccharofermentans]MBB2183953.1 CPBP family intramembrane metalloprotease [Variimorphobacter saccharofermentans]
MKEVFSKKHPYIAAVLFGLLCTFMTALGTAIPQIAGLKTNERLIVTTIFLIISIVIGFFLMYKSRYKLSEYGFRKYKNDTNHRVWWYIPLIAVEILPIAIAGILPGITVLQYIILLLFTVAVGFNEEIYFRGLALKTIEIKGSKPAIIWSSIIFGILHLANALNGKNALYLVLQMIFAFLVGWVLAEIVSITKSIWIVIIWHAAHDYISSITGETLDTTALIILAIQVGILLVYAAFIWREMKAE